MARSTPLPSDHSMDTSRLSRGERLTSFLNGTSRKETPLGNDTAWALKLKDAVTNATRAFDIEVHSAKPVLSQGCDDLADMVIEMDTSRGLLQATRTRDGQYAFEWL